MIASISPLNLAGPDLIQRALEVGVKGANDASQRFKAIIPCSLAQKQRTGIGADRKGEPYHGRQPDILGAAFDRTDE